MALMEPPIGACVFDAYGTLFDVHAAVARHAARMGPEAGAVSALWRTKQLEYTWLRSLMGRHADFAQVTADALDFALEKFAICEPDLRQHLLGAYRELACFRDALPALRMLKQRGLRLAILSNGTPAMLDAVVEHNGLGELLDGVWSVEEVGIYKPDSRVYDLAGAKLGLAAERIAFVSANGWDACGAAACGLRAVWVNRGGQPGEHLPAQPEAEIKSLAELAGMME